MWYNYKQMNLQKIIDAEGHVMEDSLDIIEFLPKPYKGDKSLLEFPL